MSRWLKAGLLLVGVGAVAVFISLSERARISATYSAPLTRFEPCPETPNCVSSDAADARHAVAPIVLTAPPGQAWAALVTAVTGLPRVGEIEVGESYLRATYRSRLFGFVDDLEVELRADEGILAVRSASRVGSNDLGANRRRVEALRAALVALGVAR